MFSKPLYDLVQSVFRLRSYRRRKHSRSIQTEALEARQMLTTFYVHSPSDGFAVQSADSSVFTSLQAAVDAAASNAGSDTIKIVGEPREFSESLVINDSSGNLTILSEQFHAGFSGDGSETVFDVTLNGNSLTLYNLAVQNGATGLAVSGTGSVKAYDISATGNGVGLDFSDLTGTVLLDGVEVSDNQDVGLNAADLDRLFVLDGEFDSNGGHGLNLLGVDRVGIRDTTFSNNAGDGVQLRDGDLFQSINVTSSSNQGRGIEVSGFQKVEIQGGEIRANEDTGIHVSTTDSTTIKKLSVVQNTGAKYGGGVYVGHGGTAVITSVTVAQNSARFGGGIYFTNLSGASTLSHSRVEDNAISGRTAFGAGIYHNSSLAVQSVQVSGNTAAGEKVAGAGIYSTGQSAQLDLTSSTISRNVLNGQQHSNGRFAYALGAGLYVGLGADAVVKTSSFAFNEANMLAVNSRTRSRGGAAYKNSSSGTTLFIQASTIWGNKAAEAGGVYGYGSGVKLRFVFLFNNENGNLGGTWQVV